MHAVMRQPLPAHARLVACYLASIAKGQVATTSSASIAAALAVKDTSSVREHVRLLAGGGWLSVERVGGHRSEARYTLLLPGAHAPPDPDHAPRPTRTLDTGRVGPGAPPGAQAPGVARAEISLSDLPQKERDLHKITTPSHSLASDARARGEDLLPGSIGIVEAAYGTSLGAAGASFVCRPSTDVEHFRVAAQCMATAEPGESLRSVAERWTREYVAERRTRLPAYFAEWCQRRLARGANGTTAGYAMPSSNHRSTPIEELASEEDLARVERGVRARGAR